MNTPQDHPEASKPDQQAIAHIGAVLREACRLQAIQYFGDDSIAVAPPEDGLRLGQVLRRYMALITLNSNDLRLVLKVHFDLDQMRSCRQARVTSSGELDAEQVIDFMKELSNQSGGRVCRAFDAQKIHMGMSVPLCTRGIYEIYSDYMPATGAMIKGGDLWRLTGGFGTVYWSCYSEIFTNVDISGVTCSTDGDDSLGELEFL